MDNLFYTYAYLREDGTPYYIGKGKGRRAFRGRKIGVKPPLNRDRILILKSGLTEEQAFRHESYLIFVLGRKDLGTGILRNRCEGGGGVSGYRHTEEAKQNLSRRFKGTNHPFYGRKGKDHPAWGISHSEKSRENRREAMLGTKNNFYGKTHSEETRKKMREAKRGRKWWNDGLGNSTLSCECPGNGWELGRFRKVR